MFPLSCHPNLKSANGPGAAGAEVVHSWGSGLITPPPTTSAGEWETAIFGWYFSPLLRRPLWGSPSVSKSLLGEQVRGIDNPPRLGKQANTSFLQCRKRSAPPPYVKSQNPNSAPFSIFLQKTFLKFQQVAFGESRYHTQTLWVSRSPISPALPSFRSNPSISASCHLSPQIQRRKAPGTHLTDRRPDPAPIPPREGRLVSACRGRGMESGGERDTHTHTD